MAFSLQNGPVYAFSPSITQSGFMTGRGGVLKSAAGIDRGLMRSVCLLILIAMITQDGARSESVTVEHPNVLAGIWRFPPHERMWAWGLGETLWSDLGPEMFCRIAPAEPEFTFDCFGPPMAIGKATLDQGEVRLSRKALSSAEGYSGRNYWIFRGKLQSNAAIAGHVGATVGGVSRVNPRPITITKQVLSESTPDRGGMAAFLGVVLEQMARGAVMFPADASPDQMAVLTPQTLRQLGAVVSILYVGEYHPVVDVDWNKGMLYRREASSLYAVEFENGERLCALRRSASGALTEFRCL